MSKSTRLKLFFTFLFLVLVALVGILTNLEKKVDDTKTVEFLELNVLPYINQNKIIFYFDSDWCRALEYDSYKAVELYGNVNGSTCLDGGTEFSPNDNQVFDLLKQKLILSRQTKFREIDKEYSVNNLINIENQYIGTAFHLNCGFCRTRYVYWPQYSKLPSDIDSEIKYIPINKDWYRIEQDWN